MKGVSQAVRITRDEQDDARVIFATMDHSDIRGLATAFHLFFAGLPRSRDGDHLWDAHIKIVEDSPHRSLTSPCQSGVQRYGIFSSWWHTSSGAGDLLASPIIQINVAADIPDKPGQLASDSDAYFVLVEFSSHTQVPIALGKAKLGFPGDVTNGLGLALLADFKCPTDPGFMAIVPGCFNENAPGVFVAGFGNGTLATARTASVLRGYQAQICHQGSSFGKASQVTNLSNEGGCGNRIETAQAHDRLYEGAHSPLSALCIKGLGQSLQCLIGAGDCLPILVEGDVLGRVIKAKPRQVSFMSLSPGTLAVVVAPVAQQHRLQLQARSRGYQPGIPSPAAARRADRF